VPVRPAIPIAFYSATDPVNARSHPVATSPGSALWAQDIDDRRPYRSELSCGQPPIAGRAGGGGTSQRDSDVLSAGTDGDIDTAFATLVQRGAGALLVTQNPFFITRREQLFALAARHALPTLYSLRRP
jgi:hypothetical protein